MPMVDSFLEFAGKFNKNRSCIEIKTLFNIGRYVWSLIRTEVVLK